MGTPSRAPGSAGPRMAPVHVVGLAATDFLDEHNAMQDELVFDAVSAALRECGLRKQEAGLAILASMDVLDGRSISNGLSTAASGGYLKDSYRIEGDSALAVTAAAEAVAAGDVEIAIAVGVHNPETRSADPDNRRAFLEQISNLGFDAHFNRPIALTAEITYALHATHATAHHGLTTAALADLAAAEISRGADHRRSIRRTHLDAATVAASPAVAWPLRDLMLPAHSTGAVAVVLASPARAGRALGRAARITGLGRGTGGYAWDGRWLTDPGGPTRAAATAAYRNAGLTSPADLDVIELTAPTPALHEPYLHALGIANPAGVSGGVPDTAGPRINPSGGALSNFPGLANGALRLLEVVEHLQDRPGSSGVAHSVDTHSGLISQDATVIVVEEI